jgi:hypothetical protein
MALIACPECGHQISSQAIFCPKCKQAKTAAAADAPKPAEQKPASSAELENYVPESAVPSTDTHFNSDAASNEELLQHEFKPSRDELMILEGRIFLIKGRLQVSDCYACLTSKRFVMCDDSGVNIMFQISTNGIASVSEGRHLLSRTIIITAMSGETCQIKSLHHHVWFAALLDSRGITEEWRRKSSAIPTGHAGTLEWHYEAGGEKVGPVPEKDIIQLVRNNHTVYRDTRVWNTYLNEWKPAKDTILSFYFCEPTIPGVDMTGIARRSGRGFFSDIRRQLKRYI